MKNEGVIGNLYRRPDNKGNLLSAPACSEAESYWLVYLGILARRQNYVHVEDIEVSSWNRKERFKTRAIKKRINGEKTWLCLDKKACGVIAADTGNSSHFQILKDYDRIPVDILSNLRAESVKGVMLRPIRNKLDTLNPNTALIDPKEGTLLKELVNDVEIGLYVQVLTLMLKNLHVQIDPHTLKANSQQFEEEAQKKHLPLLL